MGSLVSRTRSTAAHRYRGSRNAGMQLSLILNRFELYAKPGLSLEKSEAVARECILPLLLVRRHAQTLVANATDKY